MKRFTKICLTAGCVLLVLGLILGGAGWLLGAGRDIRESRRETAGQREELTIPGDALGRLELVLVSEDVALLPSLDGDAHIQYTADGDRDYVLTQTQGDTYNFARASGVTPGWHLFNLSLGDSELTAVTVYLPETYAGELSVSTISGEVRGRDLSASDCDLHTTSGDITLTGLVCGGDLTAGSTSGEISLGQIETVGSGKVNTVSGDVEVEDSAFAGLQITAISGDVDVTGATIVEGLSCTATSGDVTVRDTAAALLDCTTTSGDIAVSGGRIGDIQYATTFGSVSIDE